MAYRAYHAGHRPRRIRGFDYGTPGYYLITIVTKGRRRWFDEDRLRVLAQHCWLAIPEHHPYAALDAWVVMPDHLHGIIELRGDLPWKPTDIPPMLPNVEELRALPDTLLPRTRRNPTIVQSVISAQRRTLAVVIRTYKAAVTMEARRLGFEDFGWQGKYHDRIIRDRRALNAARIYILDNPLNEEMKGGSMAGM